jgi:ribosomal-protein-alanine N-acetyltransferase
MQIPDIPQVVSIDRMSFDPPWSQESYVYEVRESTYSHMVVLEETDEQQSPTGLQRFIRSLGNGSPEPRRRIVGYGGLWHIMDEAHISTIAVHPDYRGRGWGEILLAGMVRRSITVKAGYVVLEVRVSNTVAQKLYLKYNFQIVDTKPRYYHNNNEDAYDMRVQLEHDPDFRMIVHQRFTALQAKFKFRDLYTSVPPPRQRIKNSGFL